MGKTHTAPFSEGARPFRREDQNVNGGQLSNIGNEAGGCANDGASHLIGSKSVENDWMDTSVDDPGLIFCCDTNARRTRTRQHTVVNKKAGRQAFTLRHFFSPWQRPLSPPGIPRLE
jgi:hypothetical protein